MAAFKSAIHLSPLFRSFEPRLTNLRLVGEMVGAPNQRRRTGKEVTITTQFVRDSSPPYVSVVMPAYNAENFISRSLESVLSQVDIALEILVVDDASTDGTVRAVEAIALRDNRVRLLRLQKNGGPAVARNFGFAAAAGTWIAVLDADDAYRSGRLWTLVGLAEAHKADIAADNFVYFDPAKQESSLPALRTIPKIQHLDLRSFVNGARPYTGDADLGLLKPIFRADFLRLHGIVYPYNVRHGEDFEIVVAALRAGANYVLYRADSFYMYTRRSHGWSRTTIDYENQIERARAIAREPDIAEHGPLVDAFHLRASSLERLQADRIKHGKRAHLSSINRFLMDLRSRGKWRDAARRVKARLTLLGIGHHR